MGEGGIDTGERVVSERDAEMMKLHGERESGPNSQADLFLAEHKEEYAREGHGRTKLLADLKDFITANVDDVLDKRKNDSKAKEKFDSLSELHKTTVSLLAQEKINDDDLLRHIRDFILENNQKTNGKYKDVFRAFLSEQVIPQQLRQEKEQEIKELESIEQPRLPEDRYEIGKDLKAVFEKYAGQPIPKEKAIPAAYEFVTTATKELESREKQFENDNAELIAVVDKALEFAQKRNELFETDADQGLIAVVVKDGKIVEVDLESGIKNSGKKYLFDPKGNSDSALSLVNYAQRRNQYKDKIEGTQKEKGAKYAIQLLKKLVTNPRALTVDEYLPITRIFDRHKQYIIERLEEITHQFAKQKGINESAESLLEVIEAAREDPETIKRIEPFLRQADMLDEIAEQLFVKGRPEKQKLPMNQAQLALTV